MIFLLVITPSTRKQLLNLYDFGGNFLYANSETTPRKRYVCDRMAIYLFTSTVKIVLFLVLSFSFIICAVIYKNVFINEREMMIPVILPLIDPETERGFYINLGSQMISSTFGAIGVPAIEVVTCVMKNTISTLAAITEDSLTELKNCLEYDKNFTGERDWQFQNIIMKILDFNRFDSMNCNNKFRFIN